MVAVTTTAVVASGAVGSMVTQLPTGCQSTIINDIEYYNCNNAYYRAAYQGNNVVYVVEQP